MKILEYDNIVQSNSSTAKFFWHTGAVLQWDALIHVLSEIRFQDPGEGTNHAWKQVDQIFKNHLLVDSKKGLHTAIGKLAVRAWESYERKCHGDERIMYQVESDSLLEVLKVRTAMNGIAAQQQNRSVTPMAVDEGKLPAAAPESMLETLGAPFNFNNSSLDSSSMDWASVSVSVYLPSQPLSLSLSRLVKLPDVVIGTPAREFDADFGSCLVGSAIGRF